MINKKSQRLEGINTYSVYTGQRPLFTSEDDAMIIYDRALKCFEKQVGIKSTFSDQLDELGKEYIGDDFSGVFAADKIEMGNGHYCIFNLDESDMPGSHWVGLYKNNGKTYIYDSFGRKTKEIIKLRHIEKTITEKIIDDKLLQSYVEIKKPNLNKYKSKYKNVFHSDLDQDQGIYEENCGQRSLSWLYVIKYFGLPLALKI